MLRIGFVINRQIGRYLFFKIAAASFPAVKKTGLGIRKLRTEPKIHGDSTLRIFCGTDSRAYQLITECFCIGCIFLQFFHTLKLSECIVFQRFCGQHNFGQYTV